MLRAFEDARVARRVTLQDASGDEPWAVEYRAAREDNGYLVSAVNYWGQPQRVRILVDGHPASSIVDLRSGQALCEAELTLAPLRSMLLHVSP